MTDEQANEVIALLGALVRAVRTGAPISRRNEALLYAVGTQVIPTLVSFPVTSQSVIKQNPRRVGFWLLPNSVTPVQLVPAANNTSAGTLTLSPGNQPLQVSTLDWGALGTCEWFGVSTGPAAENVLYEILTT